MFQHMLKAKSFFFFQKPTKQNTFITEKFFPKPHKSWSSAVWSVRLAAQLETKIKA